MIRIILLRHGETTWNIEGRYQGQEDTPLSPRGIEQGKAAALALKDIHIDRAISSPSPALTTPAASLRTTIIFPSPKTRASRRSATACGKASTLKRSKRAIRKNFASGIPTLNACRCPRGKSRRRQKTRP